MPPRNPRHRHQNFVRLHKYIADCGVASRRAAESMIRLGEVTVNGRIVSEMGIKIDPESDAVKVRGRLLRSPRRKTYIALYKPTGVITTLLDPEGRETVKDYLPRVKERVFPVGRLDYDSEGLLLLTNDGDYAQAITHPRKQIKKVYLVKVKGKPKTDDFIKLVRGVSLIDGRAKANHISIHKPGKQYDWLKVVLTGGRNRQIRRMFEKIGVDVLKIRRVAIGRLTLGKMDKGQYRILTKEEADLALIQ